MTEISTWLNIFNDDGPIYEDVCGYKRLVVQTKKTKTCW